ncbi:MAG: hypothetical protein JSV52_02670 [Candidatus Zixiibacteriota bacterium]|nr:MAG: hypothetical protein JSV52_02670 [candidate division Zixibacteria bacterium]
MNRLTRGSVFCGLTSILIVIAIILGCSDDIVLEPLPSLLGEYEGRYHFITRYETSQQVTEEYYIGCRFSDQNYWISDNSVSEADCICAASGEYVMGDNVELIQKYAPCADCVFDPEKLPVGFFSLRRPPNPTTGKDSIVLTQITGDTCREILLIPAE